MCASPGSKTMQLLEAVAAADTDEDADADANGEDDDDGGTARLVEASGIVVANDAHPKRVQALLHPSSTSTTTSSSSFPPPLPSPSPPPPPLPQPPPPPSPITTLYPQALQAALERHGRATRERSRLVITCHRGEELPAPARPFGPPPPGEKPRAAPKGRAGGGGGAGAAGGRGGGDGSVGFDRVLADVPCSGDGTIRKDPSVLPRWTPAVSNQIHTAQLEIAWCAPVHAHACACSCTHARMLACAHTQAHTHMPPAHTEMHTHTHRHTGTYMHTGAGSSCCAWAG